MVQQVLKVLLVRPEPQAILEQPAQELPERLGQQEPQVRLVVQVAQEPTEPQVQPDRLDLQEQLVLLEPMVRQEQLVRMALQGLLGQMEVTEQQVLPVRQVLTELLDQQGQQVQMAQEQLQIQIKTY
jgi:hypothetical protein